VNVEAIGILIVVGGRAVGVGQPGSLEPG